MMRDLKPRLASLVRAALTGLVVVSVAACGQDSPDKLMAAAKEHLAKGERNAAAIQLKNLLSKAPDNGEARLLLGQAMFDAGDYASAEKELARAMELKQPQEKVMPTYVLSLLRQEKHKAVVGEVPKYKLFNPEAVATTQTALGDAYVRLDNSARAREAYAAALAAVPGYPRAQLGNAMLMVGEGKLDEALKETGEIIAAAPNLAEAGVLRAEILMAKGDREGARKALEAAIGGNDRYLPARLSLIGLHLDERRLDDAAKLIESTHKVAPGDLRVTYLDAALAFVRGDWERARQQVQQVLKRVPDDVQALVLAGRIDLRDEQFAAAEDKLRKAVVRAPNDVAARKLLIQIYLRMGQPAKARDTLQPIVQKGLPPDSQLLLLAGETYFANGDAKRATAFYQEAAKGQGSPQEVVARTRLGQMALAAGRSDEGLKELEAAAGRDADAYQADLSIIAAHLRRNEFDQAMKAAQALEKKQPNNPLTFQIYGTLFIAKRDLEAARRNFERALEIRPNYLSAANGLAALDIEQKKPEDARRRYEAMISREPNNDQLYIALAEFQARTGAPSADIAATLQRAVKADPQAPAARLALINFHLRSGDTKAALTAAQEALAVMPSDPRVLDAAGAAQEAAGEINQAIGTYNKLASLQPQAPQPLYRLAALYLRQKDTDKAVETLRRAQKVAPDAREVVPALAQAYVGAGRYDDAIKEARQLQKREPKFAGGWTLEGNVYLAQRKFAEAERAYREALKLDPRASTAAIGLHNALSGAGKSGEADAWSKKWMAENPKDAAMRLYLGGRELEAKNLKAAAAHYQAVIGLEPNNTLALNNLAWIGGETGDPKALGYAQRALQLEPNSAAVLDTYGTLLIKKGDTAKGLESLGRASALAPTRYDVRLNYARALAQAGQKDAARKELEALQRVKENFAGKDEVARLLKGL